MIFSNYPLRDLLVARLTEAKTKEDFEEVILVFLDELLHNIETGIYEGIKKTLE